MDITANRPLALASFFSELPRPLRDLVIESGRIVRFRAGASIHNRGDMERSFAVIEEGRVRFSRTNLNGDVRILSVLGAGEAFGELPLFAGVPRAYDAFAASDVGLRVLGHETMARLLAGPSGLRDHVLRHVARQLLVVLDMLEDERNLPLRVRLAKALVNLAQTVVDKEADSDQSVTLSVKQSDLSDQLSVSRIAMGNALADLKAKSLIETGYRTIRIGNVSRLSEWVHQHDQ